MELDATLQNQFKTLRLSPLVQRRELMYGIALAGSHQMSDEERLHDTAHAQILNLAHQQFVEALTDKGMEHADAEQVAKYIESQNTEASKLLVKMVSSLSALTRTSSLREVLPVHMRTVPNFATEPRLDASITSLLGDDSEHYSTMIRTLAARAAVQDDKIIGEVKKQDVILRFIGTSAVDDATRMRDVLNAVKKEFDIPGLFASHRPGEAKRGQIYEAQVTLESSVMKALVQAYSNDRERFSAAIANIPTEGRRL